ncbi:type II toxin-antitoxin system RelE/ParE family toxin [bacterium]|nr:type II toxin-antitoxin system RelE/ParE family toxin [bacterium]
MIKYIDIRSNTFVRRIDNLFNEICTNPFGSPGLDIKKLKGFKSDYRLRWGKYRILYTVSKDESLIYVYKIDTRGDVYK